MLVEVEDPGDPRVARYCGLRDADWRRDGVFVVEGSRAVRALVASRWEVSSFLLRPSRVDEFSDVVAGPLPVYVAPPEVFDRVAGFNVHRGVLALALRRPHPSVSELCAGAGSAPVVVVEGVNDHENMGSIFRNAAVFGVGAVLLDPTCCDPLYRRSVRVSLGHVLRVPFGRVEPWPSGLAAVRSVGFSVLALDPSATANVERVDLGVAPVAVMVGSEAHGLSAAALAMADIEVRIAMVEGVDSLNVATALAVALHRLRCRR